MDDVDALGKEGPVGKLEPLRGLCLAMNDDCSQCKYISA